MGLLACKVSGGGISGTGSFVDNGVILSDGITGMKVKCSPTVFIDSNGQLGINQVAPSAMLDIVCRAANVIGIEVNGAENQSSALVKLFTGNGSPTQNFFECNTYGGSGGNLLVISSLAKIGLGKTVPDTDIHVLRSNAEVRIETNDATDPVLSFKSTNTAHQVDIFLDESETNDILNIGDVLYVDKTSKRMGINQSSPSSMLDIVQSSDVTGIEVNGIANRSGVLLQLKEGTGTPTGNILEINSNGGSGGDYLCFNKLGNLKMIKADPWLNSNTNLFIGEQVCGAGDLAHGSGSQGWHNVGIGYHSLYSLTTGYENIAIGKYALDSIKTGYHNIAIGNYAGFYFTTGTLNIAIGRSALRGASSVTGSWNVAIGYEALNSNISGYSNVAIGIQSMYENYYGYQNVAIGYSSLKNNYNGDNNTVIGYSAAVLCTGNGNICIGYSTGGTLTSGNYNILIGYDIEPSSNSISYELNIGNLLIGNTSSKVFGINEASPETILEITHTEPYVILHNSTEEDIDGGRESKILAFGEQSGGEETTLASIVFAHDGVVDDEKGYISFSTNDGSDGDTPTERIKINSAGIVDVIGDFTAGTIQADNGFTGSFTNGGGDTVTVVGGIITDIS